jgi:hypothetical protein
MSVSKHLILFLGCGIGPDTRPLLRHDNAKAKTPQILIHASSGIQMHDPNMRAVEVTLNPSAILERLLNIYGLEIKHEIILEKEERKMLLLPANTSGQNIQK